MADQSRVRNFSIITHIDHGKSTPSDRLTGKYNTVPQRGMESQLLDSMNLEQKRGITTKARAVKFNYQAADGETYELDLTDTSDHVDFSYEVSHSLAACEDAVLIVDAAQSIEARTLANIFLALEHDLEILPVVNKIDLPAADPERAKDEIKNIIGLPAQDAPKISAEVGLNVDAVLEDIVENVPALKGDPEAPLHALILDSQYDAYQGAIVYFRVMEDIVRTGMRVKMMALGASYKVLEYGHLLPLGMGPYGELIAGKVDHFAASIKNVKDTRVGDTVTGVEHPAAEALPGYHPAHAMVCCGIYTEDGSKYPNLRDALKKLRLNDVSLSFEPESSAALGFGFRYGFLGVLHMEIIQERLEWEFDLDLITTLPSVIYRIAKTDGIVVMVDNPRSYPNPAVVGLAEGSYAKVLIISPPDYVDNIMPMCQEYRGEFKDIQYLDTSLVGLHYSMPLGKIIYGFFDTPKARARGYASLGYELDKYGLPELVGVDTLLNGDQMDTLSFIAHREKAYPRARQLCRKLRDNIPRQLFRVPVQVAINGKIIVRETVRAMRKGVLAKCYGGDITQKKKLLEKQKEGKKKMRSLGTIQILAEAFMTMLKLDEE